MAFTSRTRVAYSSLFSIQDTPQSPFFDSLLELPPDGLDLHLNKLEIEACIGPFKANLNALTLSCLRRASTGTPNTDPKRHAITTPTILFRCLFMKSPAPTGWEAMEILAGGVSRADTVFSDLTEIICTSLPNPEIPADLRHQILQLALTFMCGIGQLSVGAYLLRRSNDLFTSIVAFIKAPETETFTFEATMLVAIVANYHKSNLNAFYMQIRTTEDKTMMRKICWAANFALDTVVKSYQEISADDDTQTFAAAFGNMITKLRPDKALAPIEPPRELLKSQPIEAYAVLLPLFEFLRNPIFPLVFISAPDTKSSAASSPPSTIISLSSYLLTHASSTSSPRAIVYANLALNTLLALVQNDGVLISFTQPTDERIRLCRQRLPVLPTPPTRRAPLCAVLDCCVLWLRHNLHKRLEVQSYITCIWIIYRSIWFLWKAHIRLEYSWQGLWSAVISLLAFLSSKLDSLTTTGGVERLVRATVLLLDLALEKCELFLPTPQAVHQLVYELVRSSSTLAAQLSLLQSLAVHDPAAERRASLTNEQPAEAILTRLQGVCDYYQAKIVEAKAQTAHRAMKVVGVEIDRDGLQGLEKNEDIEPPGEVAEVGLSRFICADVLGLM
ncbi:DUF1741 domain-containing protein [Mycena kentingensis (nom. inval.)]|nr:DUF1741 domain-containing protein [Mycena kentingensis (nom. inval.)]